MFPHNDDHDDDDHDHDHDDDGGGEGGAGDGDHDDNGGGEDKEDGYDNDKLHLVTKHNKDDIDESFMTLNHIFHGRLLFCIQRFIGYKNVALNSFLLSVFGSFINFEKN